MQVLEKKKKIKIYIETVKTKKKITIYMYPAIYICRGMYTTETIQFGKFYPLTPPFWREARAEDRIGNIKRGS